MLMGTFEHRLDAKARLVLPAKFRDSLGTTVVAACGMEQCVSLYSMEEWGRFVAWMSSEPFMSSERTRKFQRVILSSAHEIDIDSAGRILLPVVLRSYACLEQDAVVNGVNDHAEIWDKKRWTDYWNDGMNVMRELAGGGVSDV